MIPAEAVIAATKALYWNPASNGAGKDAPETWTVCESAAREVLEAAATYMLAAVWDECAEGYCEQLSNKTLDWEELPNPYRKEAL